MFEVYRRWKEISVELYQERWGFKAEARNNVLINAPIKKKIITIRRGKQERTFRGHVKVATEAIQSPSRDLASLGKPRLLGCNYLSIQGCRKHLVSLQ